MTYLEAALAVLKTSRRAMTTEEITEAAIRKGLIQPGSGWLSGRSTRRRSGRR